MTLRDKFLHASGALGLATLCLVVLFLRWWIAAGLGVLAILGLCAWGVVWFLTYAFPALYNRFTSWTVHLEGGI